VLRGRISGRALYPATLLIVALLGSIDEGIQYFVPGRSFDLSDLLSNVYAAFLMLVMIFIVERRKAAAAKGSGD
jgi:VanZ family protein